MLPLLWISRRAPADNLHWNRIVHQSPSRSPAAWSATEAAAVAAQRDGQRLVEDMAEEDLVDAALRMTELDDVQLAVIVGMPVVPGGVEHARLAVQLAHALDRVGDTNAAARGAGRPVK